MQSHAADAHNIPQMIAIDNFLAFECLPINISDHLP